MEEKLALGLVKVLRQPLEAEQGEAFDSSSTVAKK